MPGGFDNWWQYPFSNDFGGTEPYGNFPKPDINIQVPAGVPISNITPGVVTAIDTSSAYGYVVTIKMDRPYNNLATHAAYLHMGTVEVAQGQRVEMYDRLGTAGPPTGGSFQNAPLGFAFYPGDKYGYGNEWNQYFQITSTPQLNPYNFLATFAGIATSSSLGAAQQYSQTGSQPCAAWDIPCILKQFDLARIGKGILGGLLVLAGVIGGIMVLLHPEAATPLGAIRAVRKVV